MIDWLVLWGVTQAAGVVVSFIPFWKVWLRMRQRIMGRTFLRIV
ncbi:MAG: hypothetical protein ACK6CP_12860 [Pseudanabaena sp.]